MENLTQSNCIEATNQVIAIMEDMTESGDKMTCETIRKEVVRQDKLTHLEKVKAETTEFKVEIPKYKVVNQMFPIIRWYYKKGNKSDNRIIHAKKLHELLGDNAFIREANKALESDNEINKYIFRRRGAGDCFVFVAF